MDNLGGVLTSGAINMIHDLPSSPPPLVRLIKYHWQRHQPKIRRLIEIVANGGHAQGTVAQSDRILSLQQKISYFEQQLGYLEDSIQGMNIRRYMLMQLCNV